jgi:ATP-binding cassette subfamily F protein uup
LIVVSHDRTFLSRTTDRLLEVHPNGTITDVPGGIDAWIARAAGVIAVPFSSEEESNTPGATSAVPLGRQVRDAEKEMSRLDRRRNSLNAKILASDDRDEQARLGTELENVQRELTVAEEYWLTLVE